MNNKKAFAPIMTLVIILAVGLVAALGYIFYQNMNNTSSSNKTSNNKSSAISDNKENTNDPIASWKSFNSSVFKISFKYPNDKKVIDCTLDNKPGPSSYLYLADLNSNKDCSGNGEGYFRIEGFADKATLDYNDTNSYSKEANYQKKAVTIDSRIATQVSYRYVIYTWVLNANVNYLIFSTFDAPSSTETYNKILSTVKFTS